MIGGVIRNGKANNNRQQEIHAMAQQASAKGASQNEGKY
jgi:hypothetical protein